MSKFLLSLRRLPMIILAALLVILAGCQATGGQGTSEPVAPAKRAQAPDFTLTSINGDEVSPGDLQGQPVLLNFWATW